MSNEFYHKYSLIANPTSAIHTKSEYQVYNLLSNVKMDMIFDVTPCSPFINRDGTSICTNCMFDLEMIQQEFFP